MRQFAWACTCFVLVLFAGCDARQPAEATEDAGVDSLMLGESGADEHGMRTYVVAFLYAGSNREQDSTEAAALQRAHLDNIRRMAEEGTLVLAGPFLDDGPLRGIYIFDVADTTEARRLTESDPAIQAGRLRMELRPWYGSAALQWVNQLHQSGPAN